MFSFGGLGFPVPAVLSTVAGFVLVLLLLRRMGVAQREKIRVAGEMDAARTIQQVLLTPDATYGHYNVDSSYLPAAEVGGDFYCVLPISGDGLTVAVGDVSGKGLKAAMVVCLVVGVVRDRAASRPGEILQALNGILADGLAGGFVTCSILRFEPSGQVAIANAGHLAPYVNGLEVQTESGLPLGIVRDHIYTESTVSLPEDGQLTLVSDGVVESASAAGELFGFERTRAISGKSAREIAEAAKAWGQNDDITVVTVRRSA